MLVLPLSYYFALDRFERVQQGEKEMIELANKKADTSMVHQKEDIVLKIQNKINAKAPINNKIGNSQSSAVFHWKGGL